MEDFMAIVSQDGEILSSTSATGIGTSPPNTLLGGSVSSSSASRRLARSPQTKVGAIGKTIVFPIFDRIAQLQTNDTLKRIISDIAIGKFPSKMNIIVDRNYANHKDSQDLDLKIGVLVYKIRKTEKTLEVINDPVVMSGKLKTFIKDTTSIDIDDSDNSDRDVVPILFVSEQKTHWNKLRPKDKESRIRIFVIKYSKEKNLTPEQSENLQSELILANVCRDLNEDRVKLNDAGEISQIIGLRITETGSFVIGGLN